MMKVTFDESVNILTIRLREGDYAESDEVVEGIIVDFDKQGKPMAIEILDASSLLGQMDRVMLEYEHVKQAA
jgi:uncharacterized protein YuzE